MAGPMIDPPCQASEFQAMARGSRLLGTSIGPSAVEEGPIKARLAPNSIDSTSSSGIEAKWKIAADARMTAVVISPA